MGDDRSIVYVENGMPVYRASSIGLPLRCLTSARLGHTAEEPPEFLKRAAEAGHDYEIIVKDLLLADGWVIGEEQGEVEVSIVDDMGEEVAVIRGHLDGNSIWHPEKDPLDRMLEVKSMSTRVFDKWQKHRFNMFQTYAAQVSVYSHAVGDKPIMYAVICRDTDELELIPYDEPPMEFEIIRQKVLAVEALAAQGLMPPCTGAQYPCAYDYLCDRSDISPTDIAISKTKGGDEKLTVAVSEYETARRAEADAKSMKATAREHILEALDGRAKVQLGLTTVSYTEGTKKTLDTKRLRSHLGDEMDKFYNETKPKTLRVNIPKEA